jgi:hypothetical protein
VSEHLVLAWVLSGGVRKRISRVWSHRTIRPLRQSFLAPAFGQNAMALPLLNGFNSSLRRIICAGRGARQIAFLPPPLAAAFCWYRHNRALRPSQRGFGKRVDKVGLH